MYFWNKLFPSCKAISKEDTKLTMARKEPEGRCTNAASLMRVTNSQMPSLSLTDVYTDQLINFKIDGVKLSLENCSKRRKANELLTTIPLRPATFKGMQREPRYKKKLLSFLSLKTEIFLLCLAQSNTK